MLHHMMHHSLNIHDETAPTWSDKIRPAPVTWFTEWTLHVTTLKIQQNSLLPPKKLANLPIFSREKTGPLFPVKQVWFVPGTRWTEKPLPAMSAPQGGWVSRLDGSRDTPPWPLATETLVELWLTKLRQLWMNLGFGKAWFFPSGYVKIVRM